MTPTTVVTWKDGRPHLVGLNIENLRINLFPKENPSQRNVGHGIHHLHHPNDAKAARWQMSRDKISGISWSCPASSTHKKHHFFPRSSLFKRKIAKKWCGNISRFAIFLAWCTSIRWIVSESFLQLGMGWRGKLQPFKLVWNQPSQAPINASAPQNLHAARLTSWRVRYDH